MFIINELSVDYKGVVVLDNKKKCFIDDVIIGDVVDIEIYKETTKYCFAKVSKFIKYSENRVNNSCKYCSCGGCELRYISDNCYYEIKKNIAISKIKPIFQNFDYSKLELFRVGDGKRRRINLKYQNGNFGFFEKNSNNLISIDNCINVVDDINFIIKKLNGVKLPNLNSVDITKVDNGITINFNFVKDFNINELKKIDFIKEYVILITYTINKNIPIDYFLKKSPVLKLKSTEIEVPQKCFLQATKESQDFMIDVVCKSLDKCKKVADLYCGIGNYSFPLSQSSKVYCFEGDELMVKSIKNNSLGHSVIVEKRDLFNQPLSCRELNEFDGIVINPPRNGAENQCKFISKSNVKKIVYVSCNIDSFVRDIKLFVGKYELKELYIIDQFYMSKYFEIIGVFELNK